MTEGQKKKVFNKIVNSETFEALEDLNVIISNNKCFSKKTIIHKERPTAKRGYRYQYYNKLCASILRVRETSQYLCVFPFNSDAPYPQAFDFYEFINCISIVFGCSDTIFRIFGQNIEDFLKKRRCFKKSNRTRTSDVEFFKFIRSASSAHPSNTTRHNKVSKRTIETYPYAIWNNASYIMSFLPGYDADADIELRAWGPATRSKTKRYYLYIDEFYMFLEKILSSFAVLIPVAEKVVLDNKEKMRCKRIRQRSSFETEHGYLMYLRRRLKVLEERCEYPDGGLLLADHILGNERINEAFKTYVRGRIKKLVKQMQTDIEIISFDDIFDDLQLADVIKDKVSDPFYIDEKFHDYLWHETVEEIETNSFQRPSERDTNANWAVYKLLTVKNVIFAKNELKGDETFADIYEITLQNIYLIKTGRY